MARKSKSVWDESKGEEQKKEEPVIIPTVIHNGKYLFTDEEKARMASELANKQIDKRIIEDEKKSVVAQYKDRADRFDWEINKLSRAIVDGFEMRDFECRVEKDFQKHIKRFIDKRTGREIGTRPLDPSDYRTSWRLKKKRSNERLTFFIEER